MAGTFTKLYYHLIFSTKNREHFIRADLEDELFHYIGGVIKGEGGYLYAIGGMPDHVHILCSLPVKLAVCDMLRKIKGGSSSWIHKKFPHLSFFQWQGGYGAFSVSHSQYEFVHNYILSQEEHHKTKSFQDEFRALLNKHGIKFDENVIWL